MIWIVNSFGAAYQGILSSQVVSLLRRTISLGLLLCYFLVLVAVGTTKGNITQTPEMMETGNGYYSTGRPPQDFVKIA